jgi:hypothetical protein
MEMWEGPGKVFAREGEEVTLGTNSWLSESTFIERLEPPDRLANSFFVLSIGIHGM